jgi:hypothetical protein
LGSILKETDIIRYQDVYGRIKWSLILLACDQMALLYL